MLSYSQNQKIIFSVRGAANPQLIEPSSISRKNEKKKEKEPIAEDSENQVQMMLKKRSKQDIVYVINSA